MNVQFSVEGHFLHRTLHVRLELRRQLMKAVPRVLKKHEDLGGQIVVEEAALVSRGSESFVGGHPAKISVGGLFLRPRIVQEVEVLALADVVFIPAAFAALGCAGRRGRGGPTRRTGVCGEREEKMGKFLLEGK